MVNNKHNNNNNNNNNIYDVYNIVIHTQKRFVWASMQVIKRLHGTCTNNSGATGSLSCAICIGFCNRFRHGAGA